MKWTCTDQDQKQYGRQISETVFEFKQDDSQLIIDLNNYTEEQKENNLNPFGYTLKEGKLKSMYGDATNWIIAECIFENSI